MTPLDRETPQARAEREAQAKREAATLWSAIRADRRAQDERTAKLRAMLLAVGDDGIA